MSPRASVIVVTRDRRDLLRDALTGLFAQSAAGDVEVLVLDDDSADDTLAMLHEEFPTVRALGSGVRRGPAAGRNLLADHALGDVLVAIDDDIVFRDSRTLAVTLDELDHPRVGAVAIPYVEAHEAPRVRQRAPDAAGPYATFRFGAGVNAMRRDVFLALGGYAEDFVQQGEESDLCLRMLAAGRVVRLGSAPPLLHLSAPPHDPEQKAYYGRRNDVLFAWRNVPAAYLAPRSAKIAARTATVAVELRSPRYALRGIGAGIAGCARGRVTRAPVSHEVYRVAHELKARGAVPVSEIEHRLPPL